MIYTRETCSEHTATGNEHALVPKHTKMKYKHQHKLTLLHRRGVYLEPSGERRSEGGKRDGGGGRVLLTAGRDQCFCIPHPTICMQSAQIVCVYNTSVVHGMQCGIGAFSWSWYTAGGRRRKVAAVSVQHCTATCIHGCGKYRMRLHSQYGSQYSAISSLSLW